MTFSDLCKKVVESYPTPQPDFPEYRLFLIETSEDEKSKHRHYCRPPISQSITHDVH
jgi:hypothetical protein